FSETMRANDKALKRFLFERMYRHYRVNRMTSKARRVVRDLFELFVNEPACLPTEWREQTDDAAPEKTARVVADYIAGMTDRYALDEHARLFNVYARN
ncbi:MAG: deoxyguanosinetriphosphate triphosphohydrolase, partial [Alphaproteobacteria bacterium]|nr:deoxyguanosinetriphosphate triphosphohydrolase [Alphaproteobacteria bacterium]